MSSWSLPLANGARRKFAGQIQRPFGVRYNPYTQSVEVLSNAQKIAALVSELRGDLCIVSNAIRKIHDVDDSVDVHGLASMLAKGIRVDSSEDTEDGEDADIEDDDAFEEKGADVDRKRV